MPLTPTSTEMAAFWGPEAPVEDADWNTRAPASLQQATDLLWLITGIQDPGPDDPRKVSLLQYAIMDMAIYLYVQTDSLAESYSSFSGERIGSYSYSKNFRREASTGATGLFWWDLVITAVRDGDWDTACNVFSVDGEQVFHRGFTQWDPTERLLHRAPLSVAPGVWEESGLFVDPADGGTRWQPNGSTSDGSWAGDPYSWPY